MIKFEDALKRAKELKKDIDNGSEYERGFVFGCRADDMYEGGNHSPVVILKEDGRAVTMPYFVSMGKGKKIRSFDI